MSLRSDAELSGEFSKKNAKIVDLDGGVDGVDTFPMETLPKNEAALRAGVQLPSAIRTYAIED